MQLNQHLGIIIILTGIVAAILISMAMRRKAELIFLQKLSLEEHKTYLENLQRKRERFWIASGIFFLGYALLFFGKFGFIGTAICVVSLILLLVNNRLSKQKK